MDSASFLTCCSREILSKASLLYQLQDDNFGLRIKL